MTPERIVLVASVVLGFSVSARAETIQVTIDKLVFAACGSEVGDTIEWVNKDALVHTATATNGDWNVNIPGNQRGEVVLKKPGAADYYCKLHPNMKGRIVVAP